MRAVFIVVFIYILNDSREHTRSHQTTRDVTGNYGAASNDAIITNRYAGHKHHIEIDVNVVSNTNSSEGISPMAVIVFIT